MPHLDSDRIVELDFDRRPDQLLFWLKNFSTNSKSLTENINWEKGKIKWLDDAKDINRAGSFRGEEQQSQQDDKGIQNFNLVINEMRLKSLSGDEPFNNLLS